MNENEKDAIALQAYYLGVNVAKDAYGVNDPDKTKHLQVLGQIADGIYTISDPENAGRGMDPNTQKVVRGIGQATIEYDRLIAESVRRGLNRSVDQAKDT